MLAVVISDEQQERFNERFAQARVDAGLPPEISDEPTLRMFAAVFAAARRRATVLLGRDRRLERR